MEIALYGEGIGYYERPGRPVGRAGDFYTSVSVGPAFGFLLASEFSRWAREGNWGSFELVEVGAHDGRLAADVLRALESFHPEVLERVRYVFVEPSAVRRAAQEVAVARWLDRARWTEAWMDSVEGVVFANELLDAFPVHRLVWDAPNRTWREWGVGIADTGLVWDRMPVSDGLDLSAVGGLEEVLPDGFIVELSPARVAWWRRAAGALRRGWLVTLDYGFAEEPVIRPERATGTLRGYRQHRISEDLLACPGEQDLTAHVDFVELRRAGEELGLETAFLLPQGRWLGQVAARIVGEGGGAAEWLRARSRQLQTLIHPSHLGHSFRALGQRRAG